MQRTFATRRLSRCNLSHKTGLVVLTTCMLLVGLGGAAPARADVLYDQYDHPATSGNRLLDSQDFEASLDAYDDQGADDVVVPAGQRWRVSGVDADGQYSGAGPATSMHVVFYANGAGDLPGSVVATRSGIGFAPGPAPGDVVVTLTSPVVLIAGTYWVSVQARQDLSSSGQWVWVTRTLQSNQGSAWRQPGNGYGFGCTAWTRTTSCAGLGLTNPDLVFRLNGAVLRTLTVAKTGAGSGTITSAPTGIDCGGDCSEDYANGTTLALTATPTPGSVFTGWSGGGCAGTGGCALVMDGDQAVTASFETADQPQVAKKCRGKRRAAAGKKRKRCKHRKKQHRRDR